MSRTFAKPVQRVAFMLCTGVAFALCIIGSFLVAIGVLAFFHPGPGVLMVGAVVLGAGVLAALLAKRVNAHRSKKQPPKVH